MNSIVSEMYCRQCQETFGNTGCTKVGVCGKSPAVAALMDRLVARLEDLASIYKPTADLVRFVSEALFCTLTNANFDDERIGRMVEEAERRLGRVMTRTRPHVFAERDPDLRSLKETTLYGLKGIAAYCHHAAVLGFEDESVFAFVFKALRRIGEHRTRDELTALALECGANAVRAMALLDRANAAVYGQPSATRVSLGVGTHPGVLVSGHDLRDLAELLEQTVGTGVDVYTHGEMLPAHYYPALRRHPHLRGNYGGAWHRQQKDFADFGGAILMTTNCIVPVADAYRDRLFTTGVAGYPGVPHVPDRVDGRPKDFSAVIRRAKACPPPRQLETGEIVGGFAHGDLTALVDRIVAAVKAGRIHRFVVMAGCDGRHPTRDYYSALARRLPDDVVILTAGCAKFRYLKEVTGDIDGIPRVLDAGQCNDSYALVRLALALRDAFGLDDVNKLPLAFDVAWYEQKAVAVLLALLSLGFRNIRLGPTLPAFLSEGVARTLSGKFELYGIRTVEDDLKAILGG